MRPVLRTKTFIPRRPAVDTTAVSLDFKPLTLSVADRIGRLLSMSPSRTNDYTLGGLYLWSDYFGYEYAIVDNTLFIKGVAEDDVTRPAFMLPVGEMPLQMSAELLRRYCTREGLGNPVLSAVPEDRLGELSAVGVDDVEELVDWADYLYEAEALVTLSGKKLSKKRNHVNRFMADNPDSRLVALDESNIADVAAFFDRMTLDPDKPVTAEFEREQVAKLLREFDRYPFEGGVLTVGDGEIVAFAIGEVVGDTLYVHIEKMNHRVSGAGEAINNLFARMMTRRHPRVRLINREEDAGDPGLRRAKESYHPVAMLRKFNVTLK